jgi:hypothetical protein
VTGLNGALRKEPSSPSLPLDELAAKVENVVSSRQTQNLPCS